MTNNVLRAMRKARGAPIPLEKAALCVTLDVIGRVGFQKDFGATAGFEAVLEGSATPPATPARRSMLKRTWDRVCEELGVWLRTYMGWADKGLGCGSGSFLLADIEAIGLSYPAPARGSSMIVMFTLLCMPPQQQESSDVGWHVHTAGGTVFASLPNPWKSACR